MINNKVYLAFLVALALVFLFFMYGIRGLRTEKVLKEGASWQEVHIVWDWNKLTAWGKQHRTSQKPEQRDTEPEGTIQGNEK